MTLARLAAALMICSLPAFAQDPQPDNRPARAEPWGQFQRAPDLATPGEPWRLIPQQPPDAVAGKNPLDRLRIGDYKVFQFKADGRARMLMPKADAGVFDSSVVQMDADTTCYSIRSYLVARDAKDSDSTHPAGYSTCRPSDRYHVKTAEIRVQTGDR